MLRDLLYRLGILRRPRVVAPWPVRIPPSGFVEMNGVTYDSFDEFVAALQRLRPNEARLVPDSKADFGRVSEVLRAFQVASVGTHLGFVGNMNFDASIDSTSTKSVS